ncbi:MAG: radical SAM protein [Pseudomonadota bacterium]
MTIGSTKSVDYYPFPFWLAYTTSLLKRDLPAVVTGIDGVVHDMTAEEFFNKIWKIKPDVLLTELTTISLRADLELLKRIKEDLGSIIIIAGNYATAVSRELLIQNLFIDFILVGEYEITAKELLNCLIDSGLDKLSNIKGIAYRSSDNNSIIVNESRGLLTDLNELPFPDREDFPATIYPDFTLYSPCISIISSRGCPAGCIYCNERHVLYNSPKYRMRNPSSVVDEMEYCIQKYGAKQFYFDDQSFVVNQKHVHDICSELINRNIIIPWTCMGDAMFSDYEMLKIMARAGCIGMKFGVESAVPEILKNIHKPLKLKQVEKVVEWCGELGIRTHATFCLGLPGETASTVQESMAFMEKINIDTAQVSKAIPYPGTPMYDWAKKNNYLTTSDLEAFDGAGKAILNYPDFSNRELDRWYEIFYKKVSRKKLFKYLKEPIQSFSIVQEMWRRKGFFSVIRSISTFINRGI